MIPQNQRSSKNYVSDKSPPEALSQYGSQSVKNSLLPYYTISILFSVVFMGHDMRLPHGNLLLGPLWRTLALLVVGAAIIGLSCLAAFRSLNWAYDSKTGDLHGLSCPQISPSMKRTDMVSQGKYCEVLVYNWDVEVRSRLTDAGYIQPNYACDCPMFDMIGDNWDEFADFRARNPVVCKVQSPCEEVKSCFTEVGGVPQPTACPRGPEEALAMPNQQGLKLWVMLSYGSNGSPNIGLEIPWVNYQNTIFTEFCDKDLTVPVAKMIAVRGLVGGLLWMVVLWLFTDIGLHLAYRQYRRKRAQKERKDLSLKELEFNEILYSHLWSKFSPPIALSRTVSITTPRANTPSTREGMASRVVSASTPRSNCGTTPRSFKVAVCQDPYLAFMSESWRLKVESFLYQRNLRTRGRRKERIVRSIFYPFFLIIFGSLISWAYLAISPRNLLKTHSVADSILDDYSTITRAFATWIILPFLFLDELTGLLVFFAHSAVTRFSKPTVIARLHHEETHDDERPLSDLSSMDSSIHSVKVVEEDLIPESVVAVVCLDGFHLSDESKLIENINSVISIVGIGRLFILHFSDALSPPDDTVTMLQSRIHPAIQYLYVPEQDKLAAVYWFSKYYLPLFQLHQPAHENVPISHIMVMDQHVWIPPTLTIPHSLLEAGDEKFGLVCFGPTVRNTAPFRDVRLKLDIMTAIFQSDRASMGDAEVGGAMLTLWERESLEVAAFDHRPLTRADGGDFAGAGINVVRTSSRRIKFVSNALIRINGIEDAGYETLFSSARRKRLIFTDCLSLLSPSAICNFNRLSSKPTNLVHVMQFIWDAIRLPVFISTAFRDPIGLGFIIVLVMVLEWIKIVVLSTVVIPASVHEERPSFFTGLVYPVVYLLYDMLVLRPVAIVAAVLWAVADHPAQSIHEREDYEKDIPPCLPYPDAPWFSAWQPIDPSV